MERGSTRCSVRATHPTHIVQKYLGHASPQMTNVYAHLHDQTARAAFEQYCTKRVNIAGQALPYDAESPTTDAEWIKHNLARVADIRPGHCRNSGRNGQVQGCVQESHERLNWFGVEGRSFGGGLFLAPQFALVRLSECRAKS